jgi:hypothetical protein
MEQAWRKENVDFAKWRVVACTCIGDLPMPVHVSGTSLQSLREEEIAVGFLRHQSDARKLSKYGPENATKSRL